MAVETVGERLSALRERSGLTLNQIAEAADYSGRSSVQRYFSLEYNPKYLDSFVAARLARALVGRGDPQITSDDLLSLTKSKTPGLVEYNYKKLGDLQRDVPVYLMEFSIVKELRASDAKIGLYLLEADTPIGYAWHPPAFPDRRGFRAIFLSGPPPFPSHEQGDLIFVDEIISPRRGDLVEIRLNLDGWEEVKADMEEGATEKSFNLVAFLRMELETLDGFLFREPTTDKPITFARNHVLSVCKLLRISDALYVPY